ncbi:MAG: hypothetical protein K8S99_11230 [Planctomycetes bacterium]|nr:hypothetical protein [Planctomycetota bacterium]
MPVYFITCHAYRSWSEGNSKGYVQRDEGLRPTNEPLAKWREGRAGQPATRFDDRQKELLLDVVEELAAEGAWALHGAGCTSTHLHTLVSFKEPACACGDVEHCLAGCAAREHAESVATRIKRIGGLRLAKAVGVNGRKWFGRGWDVSPVRGRGHFDHLMGEYLPKHRAEGGVVRVYGR